MKITRNYWVAVVSKEHVLKGKEWEIIQVCHGKAAPLKRIKKDDLVVFYSPKNSLNDKAPLQLFTAIAKMKDDEIYQVEQFKGFEPFRRKAEFLQCSETAIRPLINELTFINDKTRWGAPFRYGLVKIPEQDFHLIAKNMNCDFTKAIS